MTMAESPAHRFGQMIGDIFERTIIRYCQSIADEYDMYLDYKHPRPARNNQKDVKWTDMNGNIHKLDIVIEEGGSETKTGAPRAFIEMAWRRYTKYSKNKAQEISAAIKPLVSRYSEHAPFYGAVLAGEFTENSLNQMRTEGFKLLYFSINAVEEAFGSQGIDAHWDEGTSEEELINRIEQLEALTETQLQQIGDYLINNNAENWKTFSTYIRNALERTLESIAVISLFGDSKVFCNIQDACAYISNEENEVTFTKDSFYRYEIVVKYSNGDKIDMQFMERQAAIASLSRLK